MLLKKVFTAFAAFTLMSAAEAASISAESGGQVAAPVVVQKFDGMDGMIFGGREAGVFCSSDSGVANDQIIMLNPGRTFQAPCDGRTPFWSPKGNNTDISETFNMTLKNVSDRDVSVNIHGGVRRSARGWPVLNTFRVPARRACSIEYSPNVSFSVPRGRYPSVIRILWGAKGNSGSIALRPSASVANGGVITKGRDYIVYNITNASGEPVWNQNDRTWSGPTQGYYYIHFRSTAVPAGDYTGSLQATINCS